MPNYKCHADKGLPLNTETAWDGGAAHSAMLEAADIGGDNPDFAQARKGFLIVDDSAKELRGSYHLPFCDVIDGTLTCLITGCRAAASRLPQLEGLSDAEQNKARAVLDAYFAKADEGKKSFQAATFGFRVPVLAAAERAKEASSDGDLLTIAKAQASDPSIFDEFPPAFFTAVVSTNQRDSYYTRMHKTSLQNFAEDLNTGVSLQDSHNTYERGLGYSLRGRYIGAGGNGVQRTLGDFYAVPSDPRKAAFVNDVRSASVRDVSVGFHLGEDGRYVCDLCGMDITRDYHEHWPGVTYDIDGKAERATWTIHEARLSEVSAVYDGATPGAVILKAQRAAEEGSLTPEIARLLETQYRIKLPAAHHAWAGADIRNKKEAEMPENDARAPLESAEWTLPAAERERYRTLVAECGLKPDAPPAAIVEALRSQIAAHATERDTAVTERDALKAENERLKPQAEDGAKFRAALRKQVEETYIAAKGDRANVPAKASAWDTGTIEFLQSELADYEPERLARFAGGRITTDGAPEPDPNRVNGFIVPSAPASAYRA